MSLKEIIAISGQGGLHKYISQSRSGLIVENIETGKRIGIPTSAQVSSLGDIAIYTYDKEVPLKVVFKSMAEKAQNGPALSAKASNDEIKSFFVSVLPDYDQERVYVSNMKKVIQWYNLLQQHNLLEVLNEPDAEEETQSVE